MRFTAVALLVLALSPASSSPRVSDSHLRVHVYNRAGLPDTLVSFSEAETSRLLYPSVSIEWLNCKPSPSGQCDQYFWNGDMSVKMVPSIESGIWYRDTIAYHPDCCCGSSCA